MNLSLKPIKLFLDSVDTVLNSNTFLLQFDILSSGTADSFDSFLRSENLINQLVQQDKDRGWNMMYYFDVSTDTYKIRTGNILKENFQLKIKKPADKREYLIAMLTGDTSAGRFFSFYAKQKERTEAEIIVDHLTLLLSVDGEWELYMVEPDFLKSGHDVGSQPEHLRYFEGGSANDTATIIRCKDKGYVLLTNGID